MQTIKIGQLATKIIDYRGKSVPKSDSGIPLITARNIRQGFLDFKEDEYISKHDFEDWASKGFPKSGDVLITTEAPLGMVALFPDGKYAIGQRVICIQPNDKLIDSKYLMYQLLSTEGQRKLYKFSSGSTALGIKQSELKKIEITLLPLDLQKKAVQILSTWDKAIEAVEALIVKKKQFKRSLLRKTFSNLPNKKLSDVATIIMGQSPSSDSYNELGDGLPFVGGNADIKENETKPRFFSNQVTKIAKTDDIILTVRAPVGEVARNAIEVCIGRGVCSLRPKLPTDSSYIFQALKHKQKKWQAFEQGSTFTAVNSNDIKKFPIPWIENPHSRTSAAVILDQIDKEIDLLSMKVKLLSKQKKGLMQLLLTGKTKLN